MSLFVGPLDLNAQIELGVAIASNTCKDYEN